VGALGENLWPDDSKKHKAYLLGKEYQTEKLEHVQKMREEFLNIIWFSYRKNFPTLNYKMVPLADSFVSDTGWGCMIRVCQMIFAECLKRHLTNKKAFADGKQSRITNQPVRELDEEEKKELNSTIISWFLDTEIDPKVSPYSIQSLSVYLHERFKLKPGIWLKPSSVLFALQEIHANYGGEAAPDLQMEIYIESTIYVAQALKKVTYKDTDDDSFDKAFAEEFEVVEDNGSGEEEEENPEAANGENIAVQPTESQSQNQENNNNNDDDEHGDAVPSPVAKEREDECPNVEEENVEQNGDDSLESIYINDAREIEKLLKHKWRDSLIIFILAKIGLDKPNPQYIPFIKDLLSYPESVGMIGNIIKSTSIINLLGGKPGLAYYIVGYAEDKLMYLDPHFVQVYLA
jgi:cysteine protease ATG4